MIISNYLTKLGNISWFVSGEHINYLPKPNDWIINNCFIIRSPSLLFKEDLRKAKRSDMCSPSMERHIPSDMSSPTQETKTCSDAFNHQGNTYPLVSDKCSIIWKRHIAIPQTGKHIFWETHILSQICVPIPRKHISLVICVPPRRKHILLVICAPLAGKYVSLVICVSLPGKHIFPVTCANRETNIRRDMCCLTQETHISCDRCFPKNQGNRQTTSEFQFFDFLNFLFL